MCSNAVSRSCGGAEAVLLVVVAVKLGAEAVLLVVVAVKLGAKGVLLVVLAVESFISEMVDAVWRTMEVGGGVLSSIVSFGEGHWCLCCLLAFGIMLRKEESA